MNERPVYIGILLGAGPVLSAKSRAALTRLLDHIFTERAAKLIDDICRSADRSTQGDDSSKSLEIRQLLGFTTSLLAILEDHPNTNAGCGSELNRNGEVECDASIVLGDTSGSTIFASVGAVPEIKNPGKLCSLLIEQQLSGGNGRVSTPNFLVGTNARDYALGLGLCRDDLITDRARVAYQKWKPQIDSAAADRPKYADNYMDTVGLVVIWGDRVCASSSSGGSLLKVPGRLGPAALVGSGLDIGSDGSAAICSGFGEDISTLRLANRAVTCDTDLVDLTASFGKTTSYTQRPPLEFGVVKATNLENSVFFEWAHTTPSMICAFGCVVPSQPSRYKIVNSSRPESGGLKL